MTALALNRVSLSGALPEKSLAVPLSAPICPSPAIRMPTVALASVASCTVAVVGLVATTVPTRPSPLSTVSFAVMPSPLPALIVTVSE